MIIVFPGALGDRFRPAQAGSGTLRCWSRVLFRFGSPFGPQSELEKLSWPSLGTVFCRRTHSQDPLEAFQKAFRAKNETVKICPGFPTKFVPWRTFAAPGRSKTTSMGPDQLSRGPPGKPLERKTHLPRPSLSLPGKPIGLSFKNKHMFLCKSLKPR